MTQFPQMYSTRELAGILGVTKRAIENWRLKGYLHPVKVGSLNRYTQAEIQRFLDHSNQIGVV
jgi:DNA-binding transcriptional MerR regulator